MDPCSRTRRYLLDFFAFPFSAYCPKKKKKDKEIPSPWTWEGVINRYVLVIIGGLVFHFLHVKYPVSYVYTHYEVFMTWPFWKRFFYITFTTQLSFEHYFFAWFNAEAACMLTGISFIRDKQGRPKW